jgi:hypothetical protein
MVVAAICNYLFGVRGGLERPLGRRELAERYLLKPGSKLRLSPLGA